MSDLASLLKSAAKATVTLIAIAVAAMLVTALWQAYVVAPWTRDGRVSAQVVRIAPEISGTVIEVAVTDDQYVRRGDVLYRIDPARFELAVAQATAQLASATATWRQKAEDAKRRHGMNELVAGEEIQRANQDVVVAEAQRRQAQVAVDMAKLDLDHSVLRAPANGYVTRLRLNPGDYAVTGQSNIALVDADSFWITGYFEETKLSAIHPGAEARIRLMGFDEQLQGRVASIGRGITDTNQQANDLGLPSVEPSFSWVRLAQRVPVRVELDHLPEGVVLTAGMTGSIEVTQSGDESRARGRLTALIRRWM